MAKVLSISSQVVWGPVGNTAAVPALQAAGHEVLQMPTILLSHHPGHGKPAVQRMPAASLDDMLQSVSARGGFGQLNGVMTGYFADAEQVASVARLLEGLKTAHPGLMVLVDPVLGDNDALYIAQELAEAIRDQLLPLATITTPNIFELTWLTGRSIATGADTLAAVSTLGVAETIVTSLPVDDQHIGTLMIHGSESDFILMEKQDKVPHGTGDFLAGAYLGQRLLLPPEKAFRAAMERLHKAIMKSGNGLVLQTN